MSEAIEGPCDCPGPHFHSVVHACCDHPEYVSGSIAARMTEMADEILTLRARLTAVEALCTEHKSQCNTVACPYCWFSRDVRAALTGDDQWCGKFGDDPIHQTTTPAAAGDGD